MTFGNPQALYLLALLPALALAQWLAVRRRRRALARLGDPALVARLAEPGVEIWRRRRSLAALAACALLALAASRPQYGRVEQTLSRAGVDVLVAVDTSPSMMTSDVKPNRLEVAKESLKRLVGRLKGDRVGVVAFAGDAFLVCPVTLDLSLAMLVLDSLGPDTVGVAGTDLGRAIEIAQKAFERGGSGSPVLVLITDGEDNEERGLEAARAAADAGMRIFAVGIGTERGGPVPEGDAGYKESADGSKVVSRMDIAGLRAIAEATGGEAIAAGDRPGAAINAISAKIARMQKGEVESRRLVIHQDRFEWFAAPALALLFWFLLSVPPKNREAAAEAAEERRAA